MDQRLNELDTAIQGRIAAEQQFVREVSTELTRIIGRLTACASAVGPAGAGVQQQLDRLQQAVNTLNSRPVGNVADAVRPISDAQSSLRREGAVAQPGFFSGFNLFGSPSQASQPGQPGQDLSQSGQDLSQSGQPGQDLSQLQDQDEFQDLPEENENRANLGGRKSNRKSKRKSNRKSKRKSRR